MLRDLATVRESEFQAVLPVLLNNVGLYLFYR